MNEVGAQITRIENLNKIARELLKEQTDLEAKVNNRDEAKLRDHFAGLAMQGLIIARDENNTYLEPLARDAYTIADAMLKARKE